MNFYAETKVAAEQIRSPSGRAGSHCAPVAGGRSARAGGGEFFSGPHDCHAQGTDDQSQSTEREVRTPVDVITVGRALLELAAGNHAGIFHLAGHDRLSRFEMAQKIAAGSGFPRN